MARKTARKDGREAHIYPALRQGGRVQEPHYTSRAYARGDYLEGGFEVRDRPDVPTHEEIDLSLFAYAETDHAPHYTRDAGASDPAEAGNVARLVCGQPHYMTRDDVNEARAEAVARAVKAAIVRGEIDPSIFE